MSIADGEQERRGGEEVRQGRGDERRKRRGGRGKEDRHERRG